MATITRTTTDAIAGDVQGLAVELRYSGSATDTITLPNGRKSIVMTVAEWNRLLDCAVAGTQVPAPPGSRLDGKCLVLGCVNHKSQGKFVGGMCAACYETLTTGKIGPGATFIHALQDRLRQIVDIAS